MEIITPINSINIHTNRNFLLLSESPHPKQLLATYAAARGAVIDEVMPEANRPIPKKYIANFPYSGFKPLAKSITPLSTPPDSKEGTI